MKSAFDLDEYLARIGYRGPVEPSLAVLHALTQAHVQSIPFENIHVMQGLPVRLEPEALYEKLVVSRRGGYCFELNGLFMELLQRLHFAVRPLGARVRLATPDRSLLPPRTHLLLEVSLAGRRWITDVGVGAASLSRALLLEHGLEQPTPHDVRRLVLEDGKWFHQVRRAGHWTDVYEFTEETLPFIDRVVGNWYTSTHPDSHFRKELIAALALPDGGRVTLADKVLRLRHADESVEEHVLEDQPALLAALHRHFGIDLPAL